ncbi:hypothetical protein HDU97_002229 [Phlyctochytrium planicorne]|nr:hypothetical protein HDU97_002229 [Phlyctochytrium planicorne]
MDPMYQPIAVFPSDSNRKPFVGFGVQPTQSPYYAQLQPQIPQQQQQQQQQQQLRAFPSPPLPSPAPTFNFAPNAGPVMPTTTTAAAAAAAVNHPSSPITYTSPLMSYQSPPQWSAPLTPMSPDSGGSSGGSPVIPNGAPLIPTAAAAVEFFSQNQHQGYFGGNPVAAANGNNDRMFLNLDQLSAVTGNGGQLPYLMPGFLDEEVLRPVKRGRVDSVSGGVVPAFSALASPVGDVVADEMFVYHQQQQQQQQRFVSPMSPTSPWPQQHQHQHGDEMMMMMAAAFSADAVASLPPVIAPISVPPAPMPVQVPMVMPAPMQQVVIPKMESLSPAPSVPAVTATPTPPRKIVKRKRETPTSVSPRPAHPVLSAAATPASPAPLSPRPVAVPRDPVVPVCPVSPVAQAASACADGCGEETGVRSQKLRFDGDLYTPAWVRLAGQMKEGLCELCPKPGRWLQLKNSAFWYHKQFLHGISSVSGVAFTKPLETRVVFVYVPLAAPTGDVTNPATPVITVMVEGLCHECQKWHPLMNSKRRCTIPLSTLTGGSEVSGSFLRDPFPAVLERLPTDSADVVKILAPRHASGSFLLPTLAALEIGNVPLENVGMGMGGRHVHHLPTSANQDVRGVLENGGMTVMWFRHAHKCHRYEKPRGGKDAKEEDEGMVFCAGEEEEKVKKGRKKGVGKKGVKQQQQQQQTTQRYDAFLKDHHERLMAMARNGAQ